MINGEIVLLTSGFLFCLGFIGILKQTNIVKTLISIEIMIFASVINFCYFSGGGVIRLGHFAAFIAIVLSGLVLSVIYAICSVQLKENINVNLLSEESEK